MQFIKLNIALNPEYQEIFIAELMDMEFEGFQQEDDELIAYISKEHISLREREKIEHLLAAYPGSNYIKSEEVIDQQNWNRQWEQSIKPQTIGPFLVKPTWSTAQPGPDQISLEIDPKMAFGTGYHPTTNLMLKQIQDVTTKGSRVLDAGTGSGILSIAAAKVGAQKVLAFDNDKLCVKSARENIYLNEVPDQVKVKYGDEKVIEGEEPFDVILVNITFNAIAKMLPTFINYLKDDSIILLTGLLKENLDNTENLLMSKGLKIFNIINDEEWILIKVITKT